MTDTRLGGGRRTGRARGSDRGAFARRWVLPAVGAITPVLIIIVNVAAFVVHHLQAFRLLISILAFVSGVMLNAWWGLRVYQLIKARFPGHSLGNDANQELVVVGGMGVVIAISAFFAWLCYQGLASDKDLPNLETFLFGSLSIVLPVILREIANEALRRQSRRGADRPGTAVTGRSGPPSGE